ncbi:EKC/KEOPS complex subunit TP53RK-like isoform X1 [Crassostrea virginica]|uniref:non-specific serine/threonine protein kinase n=1 Tax=Crassostrea virginica TaxID=6565 RepID=A0A8B8EV12_CRAVI|nr:TP53-regulating kinase-like isoform X1 [Crassostrea virginica]
MELWKQGAEAKLYKTNFYGKPCIVKERFTKSYRHPILDKSLTAHRIKSEIRAMLRCRMNGILTPTVYFVNMESSCIYMEEMQDSLTVRDHIQNVQNAQDTAEAIETLTPLADAIGITLGIMHKQNIVHGDLTTSNMLLQGNPSNNKLCLIDFGLSFFENLSEDKGVDLYVLERALISTHPNTEKLFNVILQAYCRSNDTGSKDVIAKLEEVRMRGRKRTMVG